MDDKPGVPVLADLWGSMRGRPLSPGRAVRRGTASSWSSRAARAPASPPRSPRSPRRCARQGRDVVVTREPGATEVGARIRSLVLDTAERPARRRPRAEALLYAADRAHHVATVVRPALARGAVVISDRYVDSSLAYQGAGRTLPVEEVSWLSSWATGGLKPDLVVLLDVDPTRRPGPGRPPRPRHRPAGERVPLVPRAGPVRVPRPGRRRPEALPGARRDPAGRGDRGARCCERVRATAARRRPAAAVDRAAGAARRRRRHRRHRPTPEQPRRADGRARRPTRRPGRRPSPTLDGRLGATAGGRARTSAVRRVRRPARELPRDRRLRRPGRPGRGGRRRCAARPRRPPRSSRATPRRPAR